MTPRSRPTVAATLNPDDRPPISPESIRGTPTPPKLPVVPTQRPAAVEPIWEKGRLTVSKRPTKTRLSKRKFADALSALHQELRELADDVSNEANIDRRFVSFLRRLADRIPDAPPPQDELFRLGHIEDLFVGYAKTVDAEWPDFLAARYHTLTLQFDRTMRQSTAWREFKRSRRVCPTCPTDHKVSGGVRVARTCLALHQMIGAIPRIVTFVWGTIPCG
jgi:hypothetical protein